MARELSRLRHPLARRPRRHARCRSRSGARCCEQLPFEGAAAPRRAARRRHAVGTRLPRRLGRRDRQAARIAVRASPLEALAEDEVRGVAGAGRRRVHRSAGRTRRAWRAARRLLRRRRLRLRRERSAPASIPSSCSISGAGSTRSNSRRRRSRKAPACPEFARTGFAPRSSCRSRSSSGPSTASCVIHG